MKDSPPRCITPLGAENNTELYNNQVNLELRIEKSEGLLRKDSIG